VTTSTAPTDDGAEAGNGTTSFDVHRNFFLPDLALAMSFVPASRWSAADAVVLTAARRRARGEPSSSSGLSS
jgi:hypothetical protein